MSTSTLSNQADADVEAFIKEYAQHPNYRAPTGTKLHAKSWQTEAALRMLLNNLDREVAEEPEKLVVYGGTGKAARNVEALQGIIRALLKLDNQHSLLVQSGKPVVILPTHENAPRVLIANSNLVPQWANWEHFRDLEERGLMMYGQMTAGSWIYIGSQGILQGTYETFAAAAQQHFSGSLKKTLTVTGGLGGMGGAQPLAVTLNGGVCLAIEIDPKRIEKRLETRYVDRMTHSYEEARDWALAAKEAGEALSVGLVGDVSTVIHQLIADGITPELATDQTSAHDPLCGYVPSGLSLEEAEQLRKENSEEYKRRSLSSMAHHIDGLLQWKRAGSIVFDYGNNLRAFAKEGGAEKAFDIPGFVPEFVRPLFCDGKGPFRWVALSGDPEDIYTTDRELMKLFPKDAHLINWLQAAQEKVAFQGLPARICWLGLHDRQKAGLLFNDLVASGKVKGPIVIGRDHLDCGSVASPNRETEGLLDGSDAVSDWALLNLLANCAGGATWVSFHHGGGVGMGYSQHAGMVVVADGTEEAAAKLDRVLYNDPALGIVRHADAGYATALQNAQEAGLLL